MRNHLKKLALLTASALVISATLTGCAKDNEEVVETMAESTESAAVEETVAATEEISKEETAATEETTAADPTKESGQEDASEETKETEATASTKVASKQESAKTESTKTSSTKTESTKASSAKTESTTPSKGTDTANKGQSSTESSTAANSSGSSGSSTTNTGSTGGGNNAASTPAPQPTHTHSWDGGTVTKAASCSEEGVITYTCSCGETRTESIPTTAHNFQEVIYTEPTCMGAGSANLYCQNCGAWGGSYGLDALEHTVESYEKWGGDCKTPAQIGNRCSVCGLDLGDTWGSVNPNVHDFQTYTSEVWNEETMQWETVTGTCCSDCGATP